MSSKCRQIDEHLQSVDDRNTGDELHALRRVVEAFRPFSATRTIRRHYETRADHWRAVDATQRRSYASGVDAIRGQGDGEGFIKRSRCRAVDVRRSRDPLDAPLACSPQQCVLGQRRSAVA
jgi:hypothetical protein